MIKSARAMQDAKNLSVKWTEAINIACYILNRILYNTASNQGMILYSLSLYE